ncbi:hypothetical protein TYRP_012984 [Tyrophagus putrescentiae]|nr:hypothetical protein TYRP_012984 [Tyrophagus putrescentiae]
MECPWQTYTKLQESLNKGNLINANLQFVLHNGDSVSGLLDEKEEELNRRVFLLLKPLFESNTTQKIVNGCAIMSGILWHKYRIKLDNVCDLQLIDRQIQKINIFHRKRPYNKFAPPPNVNQLRTIITMIDEYLTITLRPIETVANWASYTTKMGNVIRMSLIFLRELSARMNYELMHYMFAYSNRPLFSLRCGTEKEVQTLTTKFTLDEYYQQLLEQPLFDTEKGIHFKLDLKKNLFGNIKDITRSRLVCCGNRMAAGRGTNRDGSHISPMYTHHHQHGDPITERTRFRLDQIGWLVSTFYAQLS